MASIPASIYITHLEREGSFIKVWGQTDRSLPMAIEKALQQMTPQFEQGLFSPAIENFQVGIMCCAKFKDDLYYRARITNISYLTQGMVEVLFVDYGNRDIISCMSTRTMSGLQTGLISIPAQAKDFILANVTLPSWDLSNFEMISSELRYLEFQVVPILGIGPYTLISLYLNKQDVTELLVERGLLLKMPVQFQQMTLQPLIARNTSSGVSMSTQHIPLTNPPMQPICAMQPNPTPTLLTYKALPLDNESEHQIYVSYVSDGPCLFSVQLKKMEEQLKRLMTEINCIDLQPLEEYPLPGTVCLAQSSEDGYICRAVVTSMVDGQYKVFYVDFGNTELLPFDKLFQIPFKYVIPKVMATRFALDGLENATVSIEMKCKFKEFVNNRPLFMRVKPAATKSALPLCELWDENNTKGLDMIKEAALLSYPESAPLSRGLNQDVKVSFVYGCNKIFVQLKTKENELKQLMGSLQETCNSRPLFSTNELKVGAPCCAVFPCDGMWYRGEIIEIEADSIKIKYVDFGNEGIVTYNDMRVPLPEHVTALRPQAVECCLNGYQNIEPEEKRDILLEELILDIDLSMRVVEIQGSRALVDLYDKHHYNVASLLLEKIASATSMVSPLLIQDNHRIEHRKRSSPQGNYKELRDKKPLRELNDRNDRNKQENWRQNKVSSRHDEKKAFMPNKHNFFQRRNIRNSDDNWNEQSPTEQQEKFYKTNNRNNESGWESSESPENRNSFHHANKRFDDKKGRNFTSRDDREHVNNNDSNRDWRDNENKNVSPRNQRGDSKGRSGGFEERDGCEKRDGFGRRDGFQRQEGAGWRDGFDRRDYSEKKNGFERRDGFEKKDGFEKRGGFEKRDGYEKRDGFKKITRNQSGYERKFDDHGKSNKNLNDSRSSDDGFTKPKNRDSKKDGSEKSWSDTSEKSWKKGAKSFDKQKNNKFGNSDKGFSPPSNNNEVVTETEDWDAGAVATNNVNSISYDYAAENDRFLTYNGLLGTNEAVVISWFYNPTNFYSQLTKDKVEFKKMMEELQVNYRNRRTITAVAGAPVIVRFSEDNGLYRAEVISCKLNQYQVKYIDYGNIATANEVYPIEKKYMKLPAQAVLCGLDGIGMCGRNWPRPNTFSTFFDKDNFKCQFNSFLDDRYNIDLCEDGKSVSTLLIDASLAIPIESPKMDLNVLINQQILVVLSNVISLSDIIIQLSTGVIVKASMHNLASATETHEDTLKQWIGHFVIMYVDVVLENKLEITLYDLTGQKLQIITPDEGAYDSVEPICPLPIYTKIIQGWVSYANAESIYLQPAAFADTIADFLQTMFEYYSTVPQEEVVTPTEGQIYAVLSSDTNWYRGTVTEIKGDEVIVTFVDYGNSESVPITNLKELRPQFYQPHMLALEMLIAGGKEQYSEQDITVSVTSGDLGWEGEVLAIGDEDAEADTSQPEQSDAEETELEEKSIDSPSIQQEVTLDEETVSTPRPGVSIVISHIDSPSEFYIQLTEAAESISTLQQELQAQIPSLAELENPTAGVLCAAPYSVCQQWFRAQVLDADDDITTVRFVDFGNTDVITNTDVHVKTLPTEMLSMEYHAKLCSLCVKPVGKEWSAAALDNFEYYTGVQNINAEIVHQDEKRTYVELYANDGNIGDMLKEDGLAVELQIETESGGSTGFISHLNSPSEFWIQLESSCSDLELVAEQLANASNYPELEDLTPGSLCAAIFSDDDSWYRARILSNTVAGVEVIFIDYGNSCSCSGLRELPEDLIMLPPLALKCSLQKPNGILQWSQTATDQFKQLSADGATVFNVNVLTAGETSIVQLTYNGQEVSGQLIPETKQCFVSHVDSLESFWVQFMDDNAQIENISTEMEDAESWPEVSDAQDGSIVAALHDDEVWYRAMVIRRCDEKYEVRLIDYGNTNYVTNLRRLPEECAKIHQLASNYKLDPLPRTKWGENSDQLFTKLTDHGVAIFDAEITSDDILRLYLNGVDVRSSLECVKCTPPVSLQSSPRKILPEPVELIIPENSEESDASTAFVVSEDNLADQNNAEFTESPTSQAKVIDEDPSGNQELIEVEVAGTNSRGVSIHKEAEPLSSPEESEDCVDNNNAVTTKIIEDHLEEIIENVVCSTQSNTSDVNLDKIIDNVACSTQRNTSDVEECPAPKDFKNSVIIANKSIAHNQKIKEEIDKKNDEAQVKDITHAQTAATEISDNSDAEKIDDVTKSSIEFQGKGDIPDQQIDTSPITKSIANIEVKETNNPLTKSNEDITNTLECDKTVQVLKSDEQVSKDNATSKTSDIGHSPEKDVSQEIPIKENVDGDR